MHSSRSKKVPVACDARDIGLTEGRSAEYTKAVASRTQLESQLQENEMVKKVR